MRGPREVTMLRGAEVAETATAERPMNGGQHRRQGAKCLRWCRSAGSCCCRPAPATWLAGAQPASPGNAKSNVGARTFEVRSSHSMQWSAAPINQRTLCQPRLNAIAVSFQTLLFYAKRFSVTV
jgi:hypothetical protein